MCIPTNGYHATLLPWKRLSCIFSVNLTTQLVLSICNCLPLQYSCLSMGLLSVSRYCGSQIVIALSLKPISLLKQSLKFNGFELDGHQQRCECNGNLHICYFSWSHIKEVQRFFSQKICFPNNLGNVYALNMF